MKTLAFEPNILTAKRLIPKQSYYYSEGFLHAMTGRLDCPYDPYTLKHTEYLEGHAAWRKWKEIKVNFQPAEILPFKASL